MRRASAEAADKAAMELSSSFAQKVPKLHAKKHGRRYGQLIFCRFLFLGVPPWKLSIIPFEKRTFHLPNTRKTSILGVVVFLLEIIGAKCTRLCGRGRGSRGSAEGSQGTWDMTSKFTLTLKVECVFFDAFVSLTAKNSC